MSSFLEYIRSAAQTLPIDAKGLRIAVVTNFTDQICVRVLTGMCKSAGINPVIYAAPFGQYDIEFKNLSSELNQFQADVTFIFFDAGVYSASAFTEDGAHAGEVIADIKKYSIDARGIVVINTFITPAMTPHSNLYGENEVYRTVRAFNHAAEALAAEMSNVHLINTDHIVQLVGERAARDMRSLYAFRQPFTHAMIMAVAREWFAFISALIGKSRKCIVVDLDNTLWGGVVGETGPHGIVLGPDYPGNAYQQFQRLLLQMYNRGIILAINSRNNPDDVKEVFEKNSHMILKEEHFAAIHANWNNKAENLVAIAQELNIGLDSMVFFDDDQMNRDLVRVQLPEVHVPEFSLAPEEYPNALLSLDIFHQLALTDEDRARGRMYAQERQHKDARVNAQSMEEYLSSLQIKLEVTCNDAAAVQRIAQLTQKTNQFNLTTHRYTESDIIQFMKQGLVFGGTVHDKFGTYGLTVAAIVVPQNETSAKLDTFLMSCRVMGRGIEDAFLSVIYMELRSRGLTNLSASFCPTAKNMPAASFLSRMGAAENGVIGTTVQYECSLSVNNAPHHVSIITR